MATLDPVLRSTLGRLTDNAQERRNIFWRTSAMLFTGAAAALAGGELSAGFWTKAGCTNSQIGLLNSVGAFSGAFGLLALMGLADRVKNRIRTYAICVLMTAFGSLVGVVAMLMPRSIMPLSLLIGVSIVLTILMTPFSSLSIMLDYPVLVRTVRPAIMGRMFAILATAYGILAILIGVLSASVLKNLVFPWGYGLCFVVAAFLVVARAACFAAQTELPELAVPGASRSALPFTAIIDVLKMKEFQWLVGPHVLRGMGNGVVGFAIPVALKMGMPDEIPGWATAANYAAGVLGGIALGFIADRWGAGRTTLWGDIILAVGVGTMFIFQSTPAFLALYFVLHFGRNIEDSAVPFGTTIIVPPERMGAFSAARLMVLTGSSGVGALVFGYLFDHVDPLLVFGIGAVLKLVNGLWFRWVFGLKSGK